MGAIILWSVINGLFTRLLFGSWLIGIIATPVLIFTLGAIFAVHNALLPEQHSKERERPPLRQEKKDDIPTIDEIAFWDACLGDD